MLRMANGITPLGSQPGVPADEPEKNVGVEEKFHFPSNALRMSSGKGASKSSGTVNSPAHNPNGRRVLTPVITGLTSATGFPAQTMSNVSPASTRRRYVDKSR